MNPMSSALVGGMMSSSKGAKNGFGAGVAGVSGVASPDADSASRDADTDLLTEGVAPCDAGRPRFASDVSIDRGVRCFGFRWVDSGVPGGSTLADGGAVDEAISQTERLDASSAAAASSRSAITL
ncbi:hypothetical protein DFJ73DRAFT_763366 [Zopfochytrium polystomum]|nr:hypothetical protein DFJ73DRAFT_763366 [Zopfochytrium polystomum]